MRWRYQRRSRSGCGNGRNLGQRLAAQSLGLDREPAPVVVREPETLAPKPGSEHTVLLLQVVDHILLPGCGGLHVEHLDWLANNSRYT